jgi:hypothetical protein
MDYLLLHSWGQALTILGGVLLTISYWRKEHREDLQKIDDKIDKLDAKWEANLKHMDDKWERLFSLFVQKSSFNNENK